MVAVAIGYGLDVQDQYSDIKCVEAHDILHTQEVVNCEGSVGKAKQKSIQHRRDSRDPSQRTSAVLRSLSCLKRPTRCSVSNQEEARVTESLIDCKIW